jgi:hypothetical protein
MGSEIEELLSHWCVCVYMHSPLPKHTHPDCLTVLKMPHPCYLLPATDHQDCCFIVYIILYSLLHDPSQEIQCIFINIIFVSGVICICVVAFTLIG